MEKEGGGSTYSSEAEPYRVTMQRYLESQSEHMMGHEAKVSRALLCRCAPLALQGGARAAAAAHHGDRRLLSQRHLPLQRPRGDPHAQACAQTVRPQTDRQTDRQTDSEARKAGGVRCVGKLWMAERCARGFDLTWQCVRGMAAAQPRPDRQDRALAVLW
eukprot:338676-Rhodomonas_salina.1